MRNGPPSRDRSDNDGKEDAGVFEESDPSLLRDKRRCLPAITTPMWRHLFGRSSGKAKAAIWQLAPPIPSNAIPTMIMVVFVADPMSAIISADTFHMMPNGLLDLPTMTNPATQNTLPAMMNHLLPSDMLDSSKGVGAFTSCRTNPSLNHKLRSQPLK